MSATIDRLLDAAENGIRLRGYHAVSFRELADELGIKSASVHYHFRQKEDLGLALVKRYSERFFQALEALAAKATTPEEKLAAFCKVYQASLKNSDKVCLCGLLGAETGGLPEALSRAVAAFFEANIQWVAEALPRALSTKARRAKAVQTVATLQGAMMLAISLQDLTIFDAAANQVNEDR
jgi:TetR/AcrR family transcriptional regulator, transcriptional repressor for nem operon